ncbi:hypothetical protein, partial [Robertmurraya sp.]|uniref:hypothetical protein n=1 Tax=Robertmurraya sp. TaxID=2837525 RepID=UPI0037041C93
MVELRKEFQAEKISDEVQALIGVASGKCGFTTIRKFQIKKPNFSANQNREIELFSYFIYLL